MHSVTPDFTLPCTLNIWRATNSSNHLLHFVLLTWSFSVTPYSVIIMRIWANKWLRNQQIANNQTSLKYSVFNDCNALFILRNMIHITLVTWHWSLDMCKHHNDGSRSLHIKSTPRNRITCFILITLLRQTMNHTIQKIVLTVRWSIWFPDYNLQITL